MGELPLELVLHIASFVIAERWRLEDLMCDYRNRAWRYEKDLQALRLSSYTAVSRTWQAAFEQEIWSVLCVRSEELEGDREQGWLSLKALDDFTSGAPYRVARRKWIQRINYCIVAPHRLKDNTLMAEDGYTPDNAVRKANDRAFHDAMLNLFQILSTWTFNNSRPRMVVTLCGFAREYTEMSEPNTRFVSDTRCQYRVDTRDGEKLVLPYRARFVNNDSSALPDVPFLTSLVFHIPEIDRDPQDPCVSIESAFQIAEHCPALTHFFLFARYYIRSDQAKGLRERREQFIRGLARLPSTLQSMTCLHDPEAPPMAFMEGPNLLPPSGIDDLSISLRHVSMKLRSLNLSGVSVTPDIFWPSGESQTDIFSLHWPKMESLTLTIPPRLPSGSWLLLFGDMSDDEEWDGLTLRPQVDFEAFHRFYVAAGKAARRMPRLLELRIGLYDERKIQNFEFFHSNDGDVKAKWSSEYKYVPNNEVCAAWAIRPGQLDSANDYLSNSILKISSASYDVWPPPEVDDRIQQA